MRCHEPDVRVVVASALVGERETTAIVHRYWVIRDDKLDLGRVGVSELPNTFGPDRAVEVLNALKQQKRKILIGVGAPEDIARQGVLLLKDHAPLKCCCAPPKR